MRQAEKGDYVNGAIRVLNGKYQDAILKLQPKEELIVGRDVTVCHLVLEAPWVSRKHCTISYDFEKSAYAVTDNSENGTFIDGANPLEKLKLHYLEPGTVITIGEEGVALQLM